MEEKKLYTPIQSLNNLRYHYFEGLRSNDDVEHLWFDTVENSIREGESWERDYFELKDKYDQLEGSFEDIEECSALEHQVIAIIREKRVDVDLLMISSNVDIYNLNVNKIEKRKLTEQEFNLLKEVLS